MARIDNPAVAAAADYDLYRVCGSATPTNGGLAAWRRADGTPIDPAHAVIAVARGLLGDIQQVAPLPDGTLAERMDLSEAGLDYVLRPHA